MLSIDPNTCRDNEYMGYYIGKSRSEMIFPILNKSKKTSTLHKINSLFLDWDDNHMIYRKMIKKIAKFYIRKPSSEIMLHQIFCTHLSQDFDVIIYVNIFYAKQFFTTPLSKTSVSHEPFFLKFQPFLKFWRCSNIFLFFKR